MIARLAAILALIVGAIATAPPAAAADTGVCWRGAPRCFALVQLRADNGLGGLDQDRDLQADAMAWAQRMAAAGALSHSAITYGAEIVGMGPDDATIRAAFMDSDPHRAIILDPSLHRVGIGHAWSGDTLYISVRWDY